MSLPLSLHTCRLSWRLFNVTPTTYRVHCTITRSTSRSLIRKKTLRVARARRPSCAVVNACQMACSARFPYKTLLWRVSVAWVSLSWRNSSFFARVLWHSLRTFVYHILTVLFSFLILFPNSVKSNPLGRPRHKTYHWFNIVNWIRLKSESIRNAIKMNKWILNSQKHHF